MDERDTLRAARHEAGHAVMALTFSIRFRYVEIFDAPRLGAAGVIAWTNGKAHDCDYVLALMGGSAGTMAHRAGPGRLTHVDVLLSGIKDDYMQASRIATPRHIEAFARDARTPHRYLNECHRVAHRTIRAEKVAHDRLTEALVQHRKLSYRRCLQIWDSRKAA